MRESNPLILIVIVGLILCGFYFSQDRSIEKEQMLHEQEPIEWEFTIPEIVEEISEYEQIRAKIYEVAEDNELDGHLMVAIWRLETGNGTSRAFTQYNNFFGATGKNGLYQYESFEDGLEAFAKTMVWYSSKGMHTADEMAKVFCPANPMWADRVNELIREEII